MVSRKKIVKEEIKTNQKNSTPNTNKGCGKLYDCNKKSETKENRVDIKSNGKLRHIHKHAHHKQTLVNRDCNLQLSSLSSVHFFIEFEKK